MSGARADVAIRAARVITPGGERPATILIRDGVILELADPTPSGVAEVVIPHSQVVLPGLVDSHVHVNEPGRTEWEGFATATAAAATGGVTTIVDMPLNSIPATVDVRALELKRAATRDKLAVDLAFWGGAVPGNAGELRALHEAGVVGFKCFLLPSGVDEFAPLDAAEVRVAMQRIKGFDGLLIAHAAVEALLAQTRATGCRTHVVHLSSAASLPLIRAAKAAGLPVTVETCPHYLTLRAEDVPDGATQYKCCPPIRDDANRELLWAGLADGTIDLIVSDHSPCTVEAKCLDTGDFGEAWGGIASVQLGLPAIWTEAAERAIPLTDVVRWMATAPAAFTGLADRGAIAPGRQADLCVFRTGRTLRRRSGAAAAPQPDQPYAGKGCVASSSRRGCMGSRSGRTTGVAGSSDRPQRRGRAMAEQETDARRLPDLAGVVLGGSVVYANDESFAEHRFRITSPDAVRLVRLDIFPDGGLSRLRFNGTVPTNQHDQLSQRWLDLLPPDQAAAVPHDQFFD